MSNVETSLIDALSKLIAQEKQKSSQIKKVPQNALIQ